MFRVRSIQTLPWVCIASWKRGFGNFKKHSGAQQALVSLRVNAEEVSVSVLDKGCGFDMQQLSPGPGVRCMEERVRSLGGNFMIQSAPGKGTTVSAWVPLAIRVGWRA